ncbi:MAG TPA: NAD(P)/FAD-dependent oxidoreductase [Opitutaceae bacterium]
MKTRFDVIVLGGGVSGLAAAGELARSGLRVVLLEARRRLGGRVHTRRLPGWSRPVELGAEFIHGGNQAIWSLLGKTGVPVRRLRERHWIGRDGKIRKLAHVDRAIVKVTGLIQPGKAGRLSFGAYFRRYPPQVDADAWALARGFVEGFEAAPLDAFSARSVAGESFDDEHQFGVVGGYDQVVDRLARTAREAGVSIRLGAPVRSLRWRKGAATATTGAGIEYSGRAAVVALPLGVLKARRVEGSLRFDPEPGKARRAIDAMGFGDVVRIAFRFKKGFWPRLPNRLRARRRDGFGFLHSPGAPVPVWWSLSEEPVLVAWAGGPNATSLLALTPKARKAAALRSLAASAGLQPELVERSVADWATHDWTGDPFSRGAYSFTAAGHDGAAATLRRPVGSTLFFCGEATAEGPDIGTVHGALESGRRVAGRVCKTLGAPA